MALRLLRNQGNAQQWSMFEIKRLFQLLLEKLFDCHELGCRVQTSVIDLFPGKCYAIQDYLKGSLCAGPPVKDSPQNLVSEHNLMDRFFESIRIQSAFDQDGGLNTGGLPIAILLGYPHALLLRRESKTLDSHGRHGFCF